ncbi:MAG: HNH endonuclease [Arachnia sp.]
MLRDTRICHICGHDDADTADHVVPIARGGTNDITNLKPAHHGPCPTCNRQCNREKNAREYAPIVRDSGSIQRPH